MTDIPRKREAVLMIAYSYYEQDPRVIREAEAARLNQSKYRGAGHFRYLIEYLKFFFKCLGTTTKFFLKRKYVVIHVNNMPDFLVFATIVPRLLGTKVILDIHDPMPNTFASKFKGRESGFFYWILLWQERLSAVYCNRVITVHHPVKEGILIKHGLAPQSIEVIANFADDQLFSLQKNFSIDGKIRLVFHGTILERSGLRMLMDSLARVRHKDCISLRIIGEGDFSQSLKQMIQSLGLSNMVDFDNRSYPVHSIPNLITGCNVGIVPLEISSVTNYALPLKLVEYISLGLPVVTVRNAAISYYLTEDDCIFFDWDDPNSLSAALDRIVENPQTLLHCRERSLALRDSFSWSGEKKKYVAMLRQLTSASRIV